jgi:hypothetical protein
MFFGIDLEKFPGIRVAIKNCAHLQEPERRRADEDPEQ